MENDTRMTSNHHIVYFYKFIVEGLSSVDSLMEKFGSNNSKSNSLRLRKNYVLFIADKQIDEHRLNGRLLKINVGLFRRINIDSGKEWLEKIKEENGIEFETHVFINLKENVMAATYNSDAFGILDKAITNYFNETLKIKDESEIRIEPIALPDDIIKLLKSKNINKAEFKLAGDEVRSIQDALGEGIHDIILGDNVDPILSFNLSVKYEKGKRKLDAPFVKLINYIHSKYSKEKGSNFKKRKAIIETETGYYSLIRPTLLNDGIEYDDQSEDDINNKVFDELSKSIDRKINDIHCAIAISEKEIQKQDKLDLW